MTCHIIGFPPISTLGLGLSYDASLFHVPVPPARIKAGMSLASIPTVA